MIRVVRLGSPRTADEGTRIGTVRRPPRGVPKLEFAAQNWYDVWFPNLAPSLETMKFAHAADTAPQPPHPNAIPSPWANPHLFGAVYRVGPGRGRGQAEKAGRGGAPAGENQGPAARRGPRCDILPAWT